MKGIEIRIRNQYPHCNPLPVRLTLLASLVAANARQWPKPLINSGAFTCKVAQLPPLTGTSGHCDTSVALSSRHFSSIYALIVWEGKTCVYKVAGCYYVRDE